MVRREHRRQKDRRTMSRAVSCLDLCRTARVISPRANVNGVPHDPLRHVMDVCADPAEALALSIIRFLAAGYTTGDVACWDAAYSGAEHLLGPVSGGRLVASLTALVQALRAERGGAWTFMPVACCRVTVDEQAIIDLIGAARTGDNPAIGRAAAALALRDDAPAIAAAAQHAATIIDDVAVVLPVRIGAHHVRPTRLH